MGSEMCIRDRGIVYESMMISNGYLFDGATVEQAVSHWKLKSVQITLDGTEEIYNRSKAFIYKDSKSPYQVVLANIQRLLDAGVAVLIRLNMDEHNADNLMKLADELHERFGENKKLTVYSHVLYEFLGCKEGIPADSRNEIYQKQQALYHKLVTLGYVKKLGLRKDLPLRRCIADHGGALTILPNGELGLCEQYSENNFIGHIDSEKLDELVRQSFRESWPALDACRKCFFYPECIRLKKCIEQQKCYEQMQIKVREDTLSAMRNTYEAWLKKEQISEEEPHSDC